MQSSQWMGEGSPQPKKSTDESVKDQGVVGCVFLFERHCPSCICTTWSDGKQLYQEVLARLRDAVRRKRPELCENQTWMLHHDNEPHHASLLIRSYLAKHQTCCKMSNQVFIAKVQSFFEHALYIVTFRRFRVTIVAVKKQ